MKMTNILKAILLLILGSFLLVQCEKSSVNVDNGDKPDTEVPDDPDDDEDDPGTDPDDPGTDPDDPGTDPDDPGTDPTPDKDGMYNEDYDVEAEKDWVD